MNICGGSASGENQFREQKINPPVKYETQSLLALHSFNSNRCRCTGVPAGCAVWHERPAGQHVLAENLGPTEIWWRVLSELAERGALRTNSDWRRPADMSCSHRGEAAGPRAKRFLASGLKTRNQATLVATALH